MLLPLLLPLLSLLLPVDAVPVVPNLHTRQQTFTDCLAAAGVPIVLQSDSSFAQLSSAYNLRLAYTPRTITIPTTVLQISATVKCAKQYGVRVSARGGGHSYSAQGLGGADGHVVVDLQNLHSVKYNPASTLAEVEGGARLGNIAQQLYDQGKRGIPHGTCPAVGMGHPSLGGFGISSRFWGLMVDNIEKVEVITADGALRTAKPSWNGDLLWALKGAGPSFGIITKFYFKTYSVPETIVNYSYRFSGITVDQAVAAFLDIQEFAKSAPRALGLGVSLWGNGVSFELSGAYYDKTEQDFTDLFKPLLDKLPIPTTSEVNVKGWIGTLIRYAGAQTLSVPETGYDEHTTFFAKSLVTSQASPLLASSIRTFFDYANTQGVTASQSGLPWFVIINLYGGGDSAITNPDLLLQSSYGHRDTLWNFQFYTTITPPLTPQANSSSITFLDGFDKSVRRAEDGAYVNYADPTISRADSHTLYYGQQYERLADMKKKWDNDQVFWYPQSIDPAA
ncbi:hypothetical protein DRE_07343 [Drechslerella stenobrocha 248]|uniref:FAD-binding PCMH-type domain-containing protein n=1 Tax=Drechslerella stenobrocha 248 TaxID=1043628 RepID=W7HV70_9PEZI|nr:hypothetical protein DRE_07343 [Drechslerella stenobrocha 248]